MSGTGGPRTIRERNVCDYDGPAGNPTSERRIVVVGVDIAIVPVSKSSWQMCRLTDRDRVALGGDNQKYGMQR
jgi:hypothetical protein